MNCSGLREKEYKDMIKGLKSKIITTVLDETGIRLHPKDLQISAANNLLVLKLWNSELIKKKYQSEKSLESDEFAEDLLTDLFDEYYDIREKIIEVKKQELNDTYLKDITDRLKGNLKKNKVNEAMLDSLEFEFIDYVSTKSGVLNSDWGLPAIGLRVTDFEGVDYFYTIDINKDPMVLDEKLITEELMKRIR